MPDELRELAREVFFREAASALVRQVAEVLAPRQIAVMPLKGALLQKLVYGNTTFRAISDVDILVPEAQFAEAHTALISAGFETARWEPGQWQAILRNPAGTPLPVDLHRRLTRTPRARLSAAGMFERSRADVGLFGAPVRLPAPEDLFAHLLLHATLDWISLDHLHRPADFSAVAEALSIDVRRCGNHLAAQGLLAHALVVLPLLLARTENAFLRKLLERVQIFAGPRARASAALLTWVHRRSRIDHAARRLAALTLAPSMTRALNVAIEQRLAGGAGRTDA